MAGKAKKTARVSRLEAERMLELYYKLGTFAEVAKIVDRHPDTVSRWVKILQAEKTAIIQNV